LLSIPAIAGATLFKSAKIGSSILSGDAVSFIAGAAAAMTVGLFSIDVLFRVIKDNKLYIFGIYCILAGSAVIILI
jgi:undecaprenyl pyrophosphate phosphatase UppP